MKDTKHPFLTVNGETYPFSEKLMVSSLLGEISKNSGMIVVEVNGEIIPSELFSKVLLNEGDCIEIIHFVGGG